MADYSNKKVAVSMVHERAVSRTPTTDNPLAFLGGESAIETRANMLEFKDYLLSLPCSQKEFEVTHHVEDGVYTRKLFIPKGQVLIGKIHKKACMNIVAKGDITVMTETGCARVGAGYTVQSPAGLMKIGYAHEDTIFINVFRTDETDIQKIEAEIACESFEELDVIHKRLEVL